MWLMHLPTFKWTSSFLYDRSNTRNILLLQTNEKYEIVKMLHLTQ